MAPTPMLSLTLRSFADGPPDDGWAGLLAGVRGADTAGVDRVVAPDHVVMGADLDSYGNPATGGMAGGKQPTGPDGQWLEPLTLLSVLAGQTSRVRLGTYVLLAALRRPAVLAKATATLDVLSGGRLDLGVGVGWQRAEYEAAGLAFDGRGALLDHSLAVCQALWGVTPTSFADDRLAFDGVHCRPAPLQPGGVPLWVSGTVQARSMARLARFGHGWIPWGDAVKAPGPAIEAMRTAVSAHGRDPADLRVVGTLPARRTDAGALDVDATVAAVPDLVAAGVTDLQVGLALPPDQDDAVSLLSPLVQAFRAATGRAL